MYYGILDFLAYSRYNFKDTKDTKKEQIKMVGIVLYGIIYIGGISYGGLANDFVLKGNKVYVLFPLEEEIIDYFSGRVINTESPSVVMSDEIFLYILNNLKDKLYVYRDDIFSHFINLPPGNYIRGIVYDDKIYLLDRDSSRILVFNKGVKDTEPFEYIFLSSYKPIDFQIFNNEIYLLDRRGPAPRLRVMKYDIKGNILDTLIEIKGTVGGGICTAIVDGKELFIVSNALMGRIYIYSLSQNLIIDSFGTYGDSIWEFKTPTRIMWIDEKLYILNQRNGRIDIFSFSPVHIKEGPFSGVNVDDNFLFLNLNVPKGNYEVNIFSVDGRKLHSDKFVISDNGRIEKKFKFGFKRGVYFIVLKEKKGNFFIKKGVKVK